MPPRYYNVKEAAKTIGISEVEVKQLLERRELHGYRDGADWKFKVEDIERIAKDRTAQTTPTEDEGDVLLSEVALGHSDPSASGTVIGMEPARKSMAESDIRLADSDVHLADSDIGLAADSDIGLASSDIKLAAEPAKPASGGKDAVDSKVSQFEELDLTLDQDLTLEDSNINSTPSKPGESAVDLSGKKLDDDDLVLGGSGTGSDIAIGGDSGISLVDPADSGLSLEEPLNLGTGGGDESLELGEDDMLSFTADTESSPSLKTDDDFQLTPMPDSEEADESESGSQVIALDTEAEGDEGATMIAGGAGASMAAMLDEDMSVDPTLGFGAAMPAGAAPAGELALGGQPGLLAGGMPMMQPVAALPEAPYSVLNVVSLILCTLVLVLAGIMMFDLLEHMRSWDTPHYVNSSVLDWFLSWFEK
jgi:excisionase family DNA binding protein